MPPAETIKTSGKQSPEFIRPAIVQGPDFIPGWLMDDLVSWLSEHQLDDYAEVFRRERISLSDLSLLSDEDLRELGLPMGPRRRLLAAISTERGGSNALTESDDVQGSSSSGEASRRQLTVMFCDLVGSSDNNGQ